MHHRVSLSGRRGKERFKESEDRHTIVAISTPPGTSGIGIVRLSGKDAISIAAGVFFSPKDIDLFKVPSHAIRYGFIRDGEGNNIDEVLITVMKGPSTYTREDIVEINAHGGIVPLREILRLLLRKGARLAQPGEFTKRAFLNGRIDLAQAEAVADFIRAKTAAQARVSIRQLQGGLSGEILKLKEALLDILAQLDASIDFPEEELELDPAHALQHKLKKISSGMEKLLFTAKRGRLLREGVRVAIAGRPNVGKSSLLNAILSKERAIVTPFPGTTRDTIEEEIEIDGYPVTLIDTAGLCKPENMPDIEAVKRAEMCLKEADLIVFLVDGNSGVTLEDREIFSSLNGKKIIVAVNKIDLGLRLNDGDINKFFAGLPIVKISAANKTNVEGVVEKIRMALLRGEVEGLETEVIVSLRHEEILKDADDRIREAIEGLEEGRSEELISIDVGEAVSYLGQITGEVYTEDILDRIFSKFCIGK